MITVDIYVPSVNHVYDFQLDEDTQVGNIIDEISELIEQKEHCTLAGNRAELALCLRKNSLILPADMTLDECGVRTGNSMILV